MTIQVGQPVHVHSQPHHANFFARGNPIFLGEFGFELIADSNDGVGEAGQDALDRGELSFVASPFAR